MQNYFTQYSFCQKISSFSAALFLTATLAVLAGCGSGSPGGSPASSAGTTAGTSATGSTGLGTTSTSSTTQTITGTAATGAPLVGATIYAQDSDGKIATGTSAADGTFSIVVTGGRPPFMLAAVPSAGANLYSALPAMDMTSTNTQNVNITTITTLIMYELNSGQDPASMYRNLSFSGLTASAIAAKETTVRTKLPANSMNPIFKTMYDKFVAAVGGSDPYDKALDSLGTISAITAAGVTLVNSTGVTTAYTSAAGTSSTGTAAAGSPSITMSLTDPTTGAAVASISASNNALVKAIVYDANGAVVPNAVVTFSTDAVYGAFSGGANTALTNASGVASVTLTTSNTSGGAATVTADTKVAGAPVTGSVNYAVGSSTLSLSAITLPAGTLSAYGTAGVSVNVLNNGVLYTSPMTVRFTSACAGSGKATLTASVTTVNGKATASYLDNGCNNPNPGDTITATLSNGSTVTAILPIGAPALGSIQYVSAVTNPVTTPPMITLKGTGGASRSETARITFKVVDSAGNAVGNTLVNFALNTSLGGMTLSSASATSDPATGYVVTNVIAGTFSTAVRVTATSGALYTQSDQLIVSTGVPAQDAFSISASGHNIEAWGYDGETSALTARLADHFHNPVPDGTAVYFTTEGGSVVPSCTTVNGVCTVTWTSQNLRPTNGRSTVLARATGEEAFVDINSNGTMDGAAEAIDANNASTDMAEAFVDYNENNSFDAATEPYIDFNGNGAFDAADGKYNGVLCTPGAAICAAQKSLDVRGGQIIIFSTSFADLTINGNSTIALPPCVDATGVTGSKSFKVTVVDQHGNAMPAGTTITSSSTNGTIAAGAAYTVPDTIGCRIGNDPNGVPYNCPAIPGSATFGDFGVTMISDAVWDSVLKKCTNDKPAGILTVTVATPKGNKTISTMTVTD